jgi:hypothetical protein
VPSASSEWKVETTHVQYQDVHVGIVIVMSKLIYSSKQMGNSRSLELLFSERSCNCMVYRLHCILGDVEKRNELKSVRD